MSRRASLAIAAAGTALTLLAGCGTAAIGSNDSSAPPKTELIHSIHALSAKSALTTTLSLDTTAAAISQLASMGGGSDPLTPAQAAAIAGAHITLEVLAPKGKTIGEARQSPAKTSMSLTAGTGATTYLSVRSVNGNIYLQVDIKGILALAGHSELYSSLQTRVASMPAFVKALVAGKWVSVSFATVQAIEAFIKGLAHGKIPTPGQSQTLDRRIIAALLGALTVTRASTGTTDHLVITGSIRKIARRVLAAIAKSIPAAGMFGKNAAHSVPQLPITFNAYVTGGALSKLTFDPGQFAKAHPFSLPIVAAFRRSGAPITAPSGATPITLGDLGGLFGGAFGGALGSSSSSGFAVAPTPATSSF